MDEAKRKKVEEEVQAVFTAYENALVTNNVSALVDFFWNDPKSIRLGADGGLYGYDAIVNFRKGRPAEDLARVLTRIDFTVLSASIVVATAEYRRLGSGRRGAQSQVWQKRGKTWRIISAHVSLGAAP